MIAPATTLSSRFHVRAAAWVLLLVLTFLGPYLLSRVGWLLSLLSSQVVYALPLVGAVTVLLLVFWSPNAFGLRLGSHRKVWWIYLACGALYSIYWLWGWQAFPNEVLSQAEPSQYLLTPFTEELLFRGFMYGVLVDMYPSSEASPRWISKPVLFTAILFGLGHFESIYAIGWGWGLGYMGFTFLAGLVMGYVRRRSGSVLGPFVMHAVGNFIVGL
jgi:membrane protease YdiL (CAAX protease family)